MSPDSNRPEYLNQAFEWKAKLEAYDKDFLQGMAWEWRDIDKTFERKINLLEGEIALRRSKGLPITENWIRELEYYQQLDDQVKRQIKNYGNYLTDLEAGVVRDKFDMGLAEAQGLIDASTKATYTKLASETFEMMHYTMASPALRTWITHLPILSSRLMSITGTGLAMGLPYYNIAKQLEDETGLSLGRAMTIIRTEGNRAHRMAAQYQYEKSGIVKGFKRLANKMKACPACLVLDGEFIPIGGTLYDHPNGACTMIPWVKGQNEPMWETGAQWLENQPESVQRDRLGRDYYDHWKKGEFSLKDLVTVKHNSTWGDLPELTPLRKLAKTGIYSIPKPTSPTAYDDAELRKLQKQYMKTYKTGDEVRNTLNQYDDYLKKGEYGMLRSIREYSGNGYKGINGALRTADYDLANDPSRVLDHIDNLDSIIKNAPATPRHLVLSRIDNYDFGPGGPKVGGSLSDPGYWSTSTTIEGVWKEVDGHRYSIITPKGSKGVCGIWRESIFYGENEMLFARNSEFRILEVTPQEGTSFFNIVLGYISP